MSSIGSGSSIMLSAIICGRNDQYQPDFLYRLATTLEASAEALEIAGHLARVEFVVVDWGSATWVADTVSLSQRTAARIRFICVDRDVAAAVSADNPTGFHVTRAANVGLRRARGRFCLLTGADLLMSVAGWAAVMGLLEGGAGLPVDVNRALLLIPRRRVPWSFVARQPSPQEWLRWLSLAPVVFPSDFECAPQINSGMGGILASRDLWHALRGLDEVCGPAWGFNDIDLGLRASRLVPWLEVSGYGAVMFKMDYAPGGRRARILKGGIPVNLPWLNAESSVNPPDWGLGSHEFSERQSTHIRSPTEIHEADPSMGCADCEADRAEWRRRLTAPQVRVSATKRLGPEPWFRKSTAECLHLVAWHAANRFPKVVLKVGFRDARYLYAVAHACPSAEVYVVEVATASKVGSTALIIHAAGKQLVDLGYRGYLRAVAGEAGKSLSILAQTVPGGLKPELAIIDIDSIGADAPQVAATVLGLLYPSGLLVLHAGSADSLSDFARKLCGLTSAELVVLGSGKVGFCVKRSPIQYRGGETEHDPGRVHVITPWYEFNARLRATARFIAHYGLRLIRFGRYPLYAKLVVRRVQAALR